MWSSEEESSITREMSCSLEKGSSRVWISVLGSEAGTESESESEPDSETWTTGLGCLDFLCFLIFLWILGVGDGGAAAGAGDGA